VPQLADEPESTDWLSVWFSLGSAVIALLALIAAGIAVRATVATNRTQSEQLRGWPTSFVRGHWPMSSWRPCRSRRRPRRWTSTCSRRPSG
jgi:hypothetical protein